MKRLRTFSLVVTEITMEAKRCGTQEAETEE